MSESSYLILLLMAFALGLRHGFDLDHIAVIDAITRTLKEQRRLAKGVGLLFSLGHGLVVMLMTVIMSLGLIEAKAPLFLTAFGHWVSVFFLFLFGFLSLYTSIFYEQPRVLSFSAMVLRRVELNTFNPFAILLVGGLFAFSFDTFSQVALFSMSATALGGLSTPLLLSFVFMLGMMSADGLNGFVVSSLIVSADQKSILLSRVLGLLIASSSIVLAFWVCFS